MKHADPDHARAHSHAAAIEREAGNLAENHPGIDKHKHSEDDGIQAASMLPPRSGLVPAYVLHQRHDRIDDRLRSVERNPVAAVGSEHVAASCRPPRQSQIGS